AGAQIDKNYYQGKTIKVLVSTSPGGGTDTTGRLVAQFLPKFLPGNPQTIVQNMPGGGGTIANNYFTANGKADGLLIFQDSSSGLGNFTRGGSRIKYDPRKYKALGSVTRGGSLLMIRKDAQPRLSDPIRKPRKSLSATPTGFGHGSPWESMERNFCNGTCGLSTVIRGPGSSL
ncbi:MAG: hypothetical protein WD688_09215, partial [Candidatus Binatia bacterium]